MGSRRRARELAMQFLYSLELNPGGLDERLERFWAMNLLEDGAGEEKPVEEPVREFATALARGTVEHLEEIDARVVVGENSGPLRRLRLPLGVGISGRVAQHGQPILNGRAALDFERSAAGNGDTKLASVLSALSTASLSTPKYTSCCEALSPDDQLSGSAVSMSGFEPFTGLGFQASSGSPRIAN